MILFLSLSPPPFSLAFVLPNPVMGCAVDAYRASIRLFVQILLAVLQDVQGRERGVRKERIFTLPSLLVRVGVEQNPGPDLEQAMNRLYGGMDSRLSQTEGQITLLTRKARDLNAPFGSIKRHVYFIERRCVTTDMLETELTMFENRIEHCEIYPRR